MEGPGFIPGPGTATLDAADRRWDMRAMRFARVLVVLVLGCGKSEAPPAHVASGSAPSAGSGSATAPVAGSGSAQPAPTGSAASRMTDAEVERLLRDSAAMFESLAAVTGTTCGDKAKQMHVILDQRKDLLALLGRPKPADDDTMDRVAAIADRTGLKSKLELAVVALERKVMGCEDDPEVKRAIDRVQQSAR